MTNAFSNTNKMSNLQHTVSQNDVDIAIVTETKFGNGTLDSDISLPGYTVARKDVTRTGVVLPSGLSPSSPSRTSPTRNVQPTRFYGRLSPHNVRAESLSVPSTAQGHVLRQMCP